MFVAFFTLVLWVLVFAFSVKVLENLKAADMVGDFLCRKFLGLIFVTGSGLLIFSGLIASLSTFFLAKDLELLMAAPIELETIFWARSIQALAASAWMPTAFMLPIFLAYGYVYTASLFYYLAAPLVTLPVLALAGYFSQMLVLVLVNVFPARLAKEIMGLVTIAAFCALYIAFRLIRPEELVNPQGFMNAAAYLAALDSPVSFFMPTEWAVETVWPLLSGRPGLMSPALWLALLWSTAAAWAVLTSWLAEVLLWPGYNKSLEGSSRKKGGLSLASLIINRLGRLMTPERRALVVKDLKVFFRDHTQWSQLILLAVLLVMYLYNFYILNLGRLSGGTFVLEHFFAFLNLGLVALTAATLSLRFAFPAISGEGFAYWIIKAAPMSLNDFMKIKFWLWFPPILLVSLLLVILGNYYLKVSPVMNWAAIIVTVTLTPGLCALAVGLGGSYPRFDAANPAQAPTGYGGLIYMITSSLTSLAVIGLSAWPIIKFVNVSRGVGRWGLFSAGLAAALLSGAAAILLYLMTRPMKNGLKALLEGSEKMEE
jgi:ABC-2 type transport system permease protein